MKATSESQATSEEGTVVRAASPHAARARAVGRQEAELESRAADSRTTKLVRRGWNLRAQIQILEEECEQIDRQLLANHGTGVVLILPGTCHVTLARADLVTIADPAGLKTVLGEDFDTLVMSTHKPSLRLLDLAGQADDPRAAEIRPLLRLSSGPAATWAAAPAADCLVVSDEEVA